MSRQPEFRQDPICGRWSVVAPGRSDRPKSLEGVEPCHRQNVERKPCPFCPGQETETPNEVLAIRPAGSQANGPGWQLRVVPNKFPAVDPGLPATLASRSDEWFSFAPGFGRAEVVIECAEHLADPTQLSDEKFARVLQAYRSRLHALASDHRLHYASIFKNVGAEAGASLGHTHSQIIVTEMIPELIVSELASAASYFHRNEKCVFCDLVRRELLLGDRLVARSDHFAVLMAFAPRFDFEFQIIPIHHASGFESLSDPASLELAGLLKRVLLALDFVLAQPSYNWFLHTAPLRSAELPHYHWHLEVMPRTARPAGLEWGFGTFIVTRPPEEAALELREALITMNLATG